jgi:hypothetical protein
MAVYLPNIAGRIFQPQNGRPRIAPAIDNAVTDSADNTTMPDSADTNTIIIDEEA